MRLPRPFLLPLLVASLVVLLALLGVLQYRWTGEVSDAERARLRDGARARAQQLAQEFDRELTNAALWLLVGRDSLDPEGAERYAERYERWVQHAPDPQLVKAIYRAESSEAGIRLLQFEPARRTFESVDWPTDLLPFRDSGGRSRPAGLGFSGPHEWILDEVPALVLPALRFDARAARPPNGTLMPSPPRPTDWTVLVLDRHWITSQILPRLASRHLSTGGRTDYTFVVTRAADPGTIVYRSPGADPRAKGDATTELLALRMEDATEEDLAVALPVWFGRPGAAGRDRPRFPSGGRRGFRSAEGAGRWIATVTHRLGSVEAVVVAARRRNLAASFGILALLGTSAGLLALSAARARSLARRQMEFVAGVSHELRTPIAVLCSAGENLADGVIEGAEPTRRYGALVRDEARRLGALVEQVLDFAGSYSGRRAYRQEPLAVEAIVDDALAASRLALAQDGVRLERWVAPGLPTLVGDGAALTRAVRNLVENAVKYGGARPEVAVRASAGPAGYVLIEVADRGLGIPRSEMRHLFKPFYRGREAQALQIGGSGLGLALVRSIVRAHGGDCTARSEPGRGSTFGILLPVRLGGATAGEAGIGEGDGVAHPAG